MITSRDFEQIVKTLVSVVQESKDRDFLRQRFDAELEEFMHYESDDPDKVYEFCDLVWYDVAMNGSITNQSMALIGGIDYFNIEDIWKHCTLKLVIRLWPYASFLPMSKENQLLIASSLRHYHEASARNSRVDAFKALIGIGFDDHLVLGSGSFYKVFPLMKKVLLFQLNAQIIDVVLPFIEQDSVDLVFTDGSVKEQAALTLPRNTAIINKATIPLSSMFDLYNFKDMSSQPNGKIQS